MEIGTPRTEILQENLGRIPRPFDKSIPKAIVDKPLRPETDLGKLTRQIEHATNPSSTMMKLADEMRLSGAKQLGTVLRTLHGI